MNNQFDSLHRAYLRQARQSEKYRASLFEDESKGEQQVTTVTKTVEVALDRGDLVQAFENIDSPLDKASMITSLLRRFGIDDLKLITDSFPNIDAELIKKLKNIIQIWNADYRDYLKIGDQVKMVGFVTKPHEVIDIIPTSTRRILVIVKDQFGVEHIWDWRDVAKIVDGKEILLSYDPLNKMRKN